jgi:hypothetical protein
LGFVHVLKSHSQKKMIVYILLYMHAPLAIGTFSHCFPLSSCRCSFTPSPHPPRSGAPPLPTLSGDQPRALARLLPRHRPSPHCMSPIYNCLSPPLAFHGEATAELCVDVMHTTPLDGSLGAGAMCDVRSTSHVKFGKKLAVSGC